MNYTILKNCRVCGSENLRSYLYLGLLPLSNNLHETQAEAEEAGRYPLKVLFCGDCSLSQLSIIIPPEELFSHYVYRSSISAGYVNHCREMAKTLKERHGLNKDSFHIDIAGNDGALLNEFNKVIGCKVLNVDPAVNMVPINEAQGIRQFTTFWDSTAADHLTRTGWPKANLITGTNVFAHVHNVKEFLIAAKMVLAPGGVLVLEFPYLIDFIENKEFDTIYFEHLSYFSIGPLSKLSKLVGLAVKDVEHVAIHGGSVRVTIGEAESWELAPALWIDRENEERYNDFKTYAKWAEEVREVIRRFRDTLRDMKGDGIKIGAFAASAKGNTLLNCAGITRKEIDFIIDQTPEKIGKFSPGTGIPIVNISILEAVKVDYLIILSWNFKDEIIGKCRQAGYKGKFILPLTFEIIE